MINGTISTRFLDKHSLQRDQKGVWGCGGGTLANSNFHNLST
jgi:hypothetical protein